MSFSPARFMAVVQDGFQKPNRYRIRFSMPAAMQNIPLFVQQFPTLEYYADSADLPDVGFATHNVVRYGYGPHEKRPFAAVFNDVMITFYNDSLSSNLGFFQNWMQLIQSFNMTGGIVGNNPGGNATINYSIQPYELAYRDDYVCSAQLTLLDNNGNDVVTYQMRRAWPSHIMNVKMGWAIVNDVMRITVMFSFTDWYIDPTLGGTLISAYQTASQNGQQGQQISNANQYINQLYNSGPPSY